ncbi:dephospho-CoA kinase [uncultured Chitinophaga sp.]|jgi:dephospho-CoA kinase|uniref:dephospho-CoA kinase n=1 Tax=uncultured Chitinophaga sp. TaxID=339340 RepID=UPI002632AE7E|nr:dephospho-CoA kinase [uncultured Chitinophaga sp.]
MLKVGITGGIGSGKTTVCRIFELLGIPVYYADTMAKDIMNRDPDLKEQVKHHFGSDIYDSQDLLNRQRLGNIVFNDQDKLQLLNSLVHPATIRDAEAWASRQQAPYVLKEAALLFESEAFHYLDKIIGVSAPQPLRLQRAMHRDKASRNDILARMYKQMDETVKMRLCDYIIYNDEQQMVIPQVLRLHEELLVISR